MGVYFLTSSSLQHTGDNKNCKKMPKLVLYYFNIPFWRAEVCRLALHLGEVEFEDKRVDFKFVKECGKAPFGQAPILEVDGKVISQTGAIARYCGKMGGFYPRDDDFAAAKIDELIDTATDITVAVGTTFRMKDADEKMEARKVIAEVTLPKYLTALEKIMKENGSTGFYVGTKMTIADIAMWRLFGWLSGGIVDGIPTNIMEPYNEVNENFKATDSHPEIRSWMDTHYPKK